MLIIVLLLALLLVGLAMFLVGLLAAGDPEGRAGFWLVMCVPMGLALVLTSVILGGWWLWHHYTAGVPFLT